MHSDAKLTMRQWFLGFCLPQVQHVALVRAVLDVGQVRPRFGPAGALALGTGIGRDQHDGTEHKKRGQ